MARKVISARAVTVDARKRPRTRVPHSLWISDGKTLHGWVATGSTPQTRTQPEPSPLIALNCWSPTQDTCWAECRPAPLGQREREN